MKRLFLFLMLFCITCISFAQKLDKAKDKLKEGKLEDARSEIDGFLAQEKNQKNAEAWYCKAKIYNEISKSDKLKASVPDSRMQAFDALRKYVQYDDKALILLQIDKYGPINEIYTNYYQDAASNFNSKNYQQAFTNFKNAATVSKFMIDKGWLNIKLDTNSNLYAAVSAERLSQPDSAAIYYGVLAENKVKGEGMVEIYKWLSNHYYEKKDMVNAQKYLDLGKQAYPDDPFWSGLELDMVRQSGNKEQLFAKYEEMIPQHPDNYLYQYNYAVELYHYGYDTSIGKRPANYNDYINKSFENIQKVIKIKPDYPQAQLFAGQILYNQGVDILAESKKIKSTKPDDVKKKNELKAQFMQKFDAAIPYFLEVDKLLGPQGKLKMEEKQTLKEAYDLLITIYDQKNMKDKVHDFEVKFNDVDRVH